MYEQSLRKYPDYRLPQVKANHISKAQIIKYQKMNHYRNKSLANYLLAYTQKQPLLLQGRSSNKNIIIVQKPLGLQKIRHRKIKTQCRQLQKQFKNQLTYLKKQVQHLASQLKQEKESRFTEQTLQKLSRKNNSLSSVNNYYNIPSLQNQTQNLTKKSKLSIFNQNEHFNQSKQSKKYSLVLQQGKYESLKKKIQDSNVKKRIYYTSKHYKGRYKIFSKFKKVANAILFVIYLKKFRQKMVTKKLMYFQQNIANQVQKKISKIKQIFTGQVFKFLQKIAWKNQLNLVISSKDPQSLMIQKFTHTKKYINILFDNLSEIQFNKSFLDKIVQPTYFLCKHGNFGVHYSFYTSQQLDLMCISQQQYIRGDKNLQKSYIITLLFVKIFLFNMILRPWKMNEIQFHQNSIKNKNLILIGGIIYRLVTQIQQNYLKMANQNYVIGNWKNINQKNQRKHIQNNAKYNKIRSCKSMILEDQFLHEDDQLKEKKSQQIFGVLSRKYADEYYNISEWKTERKKIINIVNLIHSRISQYHKGIAKKCF